MFHPINAPIHAAVPAYLDYPSCNVARLSIALAALLFAFGGPAAAQEVPASEQAGRTQVAQAWIRDLFGPSFFPAPSDNDTLDAPPPHTREPAAPAGTYRTVCVRLCDGFHSPVSFATTRSRFQRDAERCEQSCPNRSRLFTLPAGSDDYSRMNDLDGEPYSSLENAFRYQKEYVADCTCQGNPWDEAALARHRAYAAAETEAKSKAQRTKIGKAMPQMSRFDPSARK